MDSFQEYVGLNVLIIAMQKGDGVVNGGESYGWDPKQAEVTTVSTSREYILFQCNVPEKIKFFFY